MKVNRISAKTIKNTSVVIIDGDGLIDSIVIRLAVS